MNFIKWNVSHEYYKDNTFVHYNEPTDIWETTVLLFIISCISTLCNETNVRLFFPSSFRVHADAWQPRQPTGGRCRPVRNPPPVSCIPRPGERPEVDVAPPVGTTCQSLPVAARVLPVKALPLPPHSPHTEWVLCIVLIFHEDLLGEVALDIDVDNPVISWLLTWGALRWYRGFIRNSIIFKYKIKGV